MLAAVRALDEPSRSAIWERYYAGRSVADIAARAGVAPRAIESRLRRGRERVRAALEAELGPRRNWLPALVVLAGESRRPAGALAAPGLLAGAVAVGGVLVVALGRGGAKPEPSTLVGEREDDAELEAELEAELDRPATPDGDETAAAHERAPLGAGAATSEVAAAEGIARRALHGTLELAPGVEPADLWLVALDADTREELARLELGERRAWRVEAAADVAVELVAFGRDTSVAWRRVEPDERAERRIELALDAGAPFAGTVVDAGGVPLAGYAVTAYVDEPGERVRVGEHLLLPSNGRWLRAMASAHSGDDGRFEVRGLAPGPHDALLAPAESPWSTALVVALPTESSARVVLPAPDAVLRAEHEELRVQVVGPDGPLEGVAVACRRRAVLEAQLAAGVEQPTNAFPAPYDGRLCVIYDPSQDVGLLFGRTGFVPVMLMPNDAVRGPDGVAVVTLERKRVGPSLRLTVRCEGEATPQRLGIDLIPAWDGTTPWRPSLQHVVDFDGATLVLEDVPEDRYALVVRALSASPLAEAERDVEVGPAGADVAVVLALGSVVHLVPDADAGTSEGLEAWFEADDELRTASPPTVQPLRAGVAVPLHPRVPLGRWTVTVKRADEELWRGVLDLTSTEPTALRLPANGR